MRMLASLGLAVTGATALIATTTSAAGRVPEQGQVVPVTLAAPVYPPIATAARVTGDVVVLLRIRPDGTVADVELLNGIPLLNDAAVSAARDSRFDCRACDGDGGAYRVRYSFQFDVPQQSPDVGGEGEAHVHVTAQAPRLHILFSDLSVRSVTCAYLWRCGSQWGGMSCDAEDGGGTLTSKMT
jgi:TonB family protein